MKVVINPKWISASYERRILNPDGTEMPWFTSERFETEDDCQNGVNQIPIYIMVGDDHEGVTPICADRKIAYGEEVPPEVFNAAALLEKYFSERGFRIWEFMGVRSR
ncbi:MAG: hypothetical protein E6Q97_34705 [Desulfurellales bacterium]|nr:MAG: hypothetical protein E6Q97_34705 [Desulfurellales bacterium]